jgi:hypothetical protein
MRGGLLIDATRGSLRVRKWPRKRGKPKSLVTQLQNAWFKNVAKFSKSCDPRQMQLAIETTKDTGALPRDLLIHAMAGNLCDIELEDGTIITKREGRIYNTVFQGFILNLTLDQAFATGSFYAPTWALPIRDTGGFWNVGQPDRITIPVGVKLMALQAGWRSVNPQNSLSALFIRSTTGTNLATQQIDVNSRAGHSVTTGPFLVNAGDQFRAEFFQNASYDLAAEPATFFSGIILESGP